MTVRNSLKDYVAATDCLYMDLSIMVLSFVMVLIICRI